MSRPVSIMGIYKVENAVTGKSYIGCSNNIHVRWSDHIIQIHGGVHVNKRLQAEVNEHGISALRFSILELVQRKEDLVAREKHWIQLLKPGKLYNTKDVLQPSRRLPRKK